MSHNPKTVDVAQLTARIGLPADQQSTVGTWTGEPDLWQAGSWVPAWTDAEAEALVKLWHEMYADAIDNGTGF